MELCGNVIAAIAEFFGVTDLESQAEFPVEVEKIVNLIDKVSTKVMTHGVVK